jgi:hypothetical protein
MQILKELEVLIPPLTSEEFKQLERNILEEGIRDPLVTWNGILVDGHNRYRIATEYDIELCYSGKGIYRHECGKGMDDLQSIWQA